MEDRPTDLLADFVHGLRFEDFSGDAVESAKLLLLDYVASAMAGYRINRVFNESLWAVVGGMGGRRESRVFFHGARLPAPHAALLNAALDAGSQSWSAEQN